MRRWSGQLRKQTHEWRDPTCYWKMLLWEAHGALSQWYCTIFTRQGPRTVMTDHTATPERSTPTPERGAPSLAFAPNGCADGRMSSARPVASLPALVLQTVRPDEPVPEVPRMMAGVGLCASPELLRNRPSRTGETANPTVTSPRHASPLPLCPRSVSIKGTRNDEAVLCTLDKTYMLRLAESSNVMLLAPTTEKKRKQREEQEEPASEADADAGQESEKLEVQASVSAHFEIIRCAPKTGGLAALLSARPYTGANDSESTASLDTAAAAASADAHRHCSAAELEEPEVTVQASSAELRTAWREARAPPSTAAGACSSRSWNRTSWRLLPLCGA